MMYTKILVPVPPEHETRAPLSLEAAQKLLSAGGQITILTVLEPIPSYVAQYLPLDHLEENRATIQAALAAEFGNLPHHQIRVEYGPPAQTILAVAEEGGHDCIIIASHKPGMQNYFLGSTASRVVRHANCGVHVLR